MSQDKVNRSFDWKIKSAQDGGKQFWAGLLRKKNAGGYFPLRSTSQNKFDGDSMHDLSRPKYEPGRTLFSKPIPLSRDPIQTKGLFRERFVHSSVDLTQGKEFETTNTNRARMKRSFDYKKPDPPTEKDDIEDTPGPNSYNVNNNTIQDRIRTMLGTKLKGRHLMDKEKESSPGPASYILEPINQSKKDKYTIPKSRRDLLDRELVLVPGPGSYGLDLTFKPKNSITIAKAVEKPKHPEDGPGPGQYDVLKGNKFGPKFRFGTSSRFYSKTEEDVRESSVGPLTYHPKYETILQRQPAVRIGTESKFPKVVDENIPGAGMYKIKEDGLNKRGVIFTKGRRFLRKLGQVIISF